MHTGFSYCGAYFRGSRGGIDSHGCTREHILLGRMVHQGVKCQVPHCQAQAAVSLRLVDRDKVRKPSWVFRVVRDLHVSGNVVEGEA